MISRTEEYQHAHGLQKIRKFIFLYRAVFFILGLAAVSMIGVVALFNMSNANNIDFMTRSSIRQSTLAFNDLEKSLVNTLSATIESLMINKEMAEAFVNRDTRTLLNITSPLLEHFKEQNGITHWYFILPGPEKKCFLRVHSPGLNNDTIRRFTLDRSIETKRFSAGKELGKTALALRGVHPYYYKGQLIGYMELAIDMQYLMSRLKEHTGNEYGVLIDKSFLNYRKWRSVTAQKGIRDNWNDLEHHLLVNQTGDAVKYGLLDKTYKDPAIIDNIGVVLEEFSKTGGHFVRGVFPFFDAQYRKIGGIFILKNVTYTIGEIKAKKKTILLMLIGFMGVVTFFMIFFHKRAEKELRRYRSRLEEMVEEATAEIREANRKLNLEIDEHKIIAQALEEECKAREAAEKKQIRAVKQAERTARMASIGVMAAGITHEINQPLNAIKVTADSINFWHKRHPGMLPETFAEQLEIISKSVKRIVEIIQHMRAFWVIRESPAITTVDINLAVGNALSLTRQQLHSHGITIKKELHPQPLPVDGNLIHFEQIIINLVVNSIHALDEVKGNNKEIRLNTRFEKNENRVELTVTDNGPGLPPESIDKIFDPFFSSNSSGEGMGLGLAIVKKYVDRYNGIIKADNTTKANRVTGASFQLSFPPGGAENIGKSVEVNTGQNQGVNRENLIDR